jgi:hypothetical protein
VKRFPGYQVTSTRWDGLKCTVIVQSETVCGNKIQARSTVYVPPAQRDKNLSKIEKETEAVAVRNLGYENETSVAHCIRRGKHKPHVK